MPPATLPFSLETLRSHAIFVPPASSSTDDGWELVDTPPAGGGGGTGLPAPKNARMVVREKDLLVAFGKEVRMTSLAGEAWEVHDGAVGGYKTLKSPHLTFTIHQLVLNPTGRLLAVVGHHQLVILVLPRAGFASSVGGDVACRSFPVDEYQHSPSSTVALTKVCWHPWGEGGNSLWALAANGKLFEYDVLRPQDPVQTFNFLPDKSGASTTKFSAIDPLAQYATSFAFSDGDMDFGPLIVYALMANGDIYTMGPVLPLHSEVPATYLQNLQAWMQEKEKRLVDDDGSAEHAALVGRTALQTQWVNAVVRQAGGEGDEEKSSTRSPMSPRRRGYGLRDRSPSPPPQPDRPPPPPGMVRVHPPHLTASGGPAPGVHRPLMRQGPLLLDPAPQEVGNGDIVDEQMATDFTILRAGAEGTNKAKESELDEGTRVNVLAIAWSGGRVDLGVEVSPPEPRWMSSRDPAPMDLMLPIIESVLVTFPQSVDEEAIGVNAPEFVADPIHPDVTYVQHAFGIDAISVAPWVTQLLAGDNDTLSPSDVASLVEASPSKPIVGTVTFCNITLGYGLLTLATTGQLAAVEMDFRVQDRGVAIAEEPAVPDENSQSLLVKPFDLDALVASINKVPFNPRAAVRKVPDSNKPLNTVGPEHLRALAEVVSQVRAKAEAVRAASVTTERRAELAMTEYARQLKVLGDAKSGLDGVRERAAANVVRTASMATAQAKLGERLDVILNALLAEYRPQIGAVERKWFDELERLRARVQGGARGAGRRKTQGFVHTAQVLKEQLAVVRPLVEKEETRRREAEAAQTAGAGQYGQKQLRPMRAALDDRSDELARMMRKLESLSVRVQDEEEVEP